MLALRRDLDSASLTVVIASNGPPHWVGRLGDAAVVAPDDGDLPGMVTRAAAVLIDSEVDAPLAVARRVRRTAPETQLVLVASPERSRALGRSMLFTPGLGEPWVVSPDEVGPDLVRRAAAIAEQRRAHGRRVEHLSREVATFRLHDPRTRRVSDQYLATLLELLPEPVFALDTEGRILFANPAARAAFPTDPDGREREDIRSVLAGVDVERLDGVLARGATDVTRDQISTGTGGDRRMYDISVARVESERPLLALVLHDVTDAARARSKLEEALAHRRRFYSSMSHELRTPINAIIGYNDLLDGEVFGELSPDQKGALGRISVAARHLLDLVNDVLDISKIEAGKLEVEPEDVRLADLVQELGTTMELLARERRVELLFHVDPSCERSIRTDPRRVRQILINLVSNAVRYGEGGQVEVRCERGEDEIRIAVRDEGPGIEQERLEDIFSEFVQLRGTGEGTGLGLAIARSLAEALDGRLEAESEPGAGSTFTLVLPAGT